MTLSNRVISWLAIAPSVVYVTAVVGLMAARPMSGHQPLPDGAMPAVTVLSICVPLVSVAGATVLRRRRDA